MSKINLTFQERKWLSGQLLNRLSFYNDCKGIKPWYQGKCVSAMLTIEDGEHVKLEVKESLMCLSILNQRLRALNDAVSVGNAYDLMLLDAVGKDTLLELDFCYGLLAKFEKKRKTQSEGFGSYYQGKLSVIDRLKAANMIYLSHTKLNEVYKIGFVDGESYCCVFELSHMVRLSDLKFYRLPSDPLSYGKKHFSVITDRGSAATLLSDCLECEYPPYQLQFIRQLLN